MTIPVWQGGGAYERKDGASDVLLGKELYDRKRHLLVEDGETVVNMGKHSVLIMKPVREMQVDEYGKESSSN